MPGCENSVAVVLAGGQSRRFDGGQKALATIGGRPMLARVLQTAGSVTAESPIVAVATGDQREAYADAVELPVTFVTDSPEMSGPLAGLSSAVAATRADWLLVLGCDMPLVDASALAWVADQRTEREDALVPRTADGIHPLHAWYRRSAVASALESVGDDRRLQAVLDRLAVEVVSASDAPAGVPLDRSLANVNTRAELAAAREHLDA